MNKTGFKITAAWARETATEVLGEKVKKQIDQCEDAIQAAVKQNKMDCSVSIYADQLVIKELNSRGFTVKKHDAINQRETDYLTISW